MKNYLNKYLQELLNSRTVVSFSAVRCRYGKFTIYSIVGHEMNMVHLTLASGKHRKAVRQLCCISPNIEVRSLQQENFPYNGIFQDYFSGKLFDFSLDITRSPFLETGTEFQQKVWRSIKTVPYGSTITYQQLAERAGSPGGARAAGTACGANPLGILIPCHRIVAANGLGGYAGGIVNKKNLLHLEATAFDK